MNNWTRNRNELIDIGADLCRKGYTSQGVAESMAEQHYIGTSQRLAASLLARAIASQFYTRYAGQTEARDTICRMADALRTEGWKALFDTDNVSCLWRHESGISVNNNGGYFRSYDEATRRTYQSQTRALLLS